MVRGKALFLSVTGIIFLLLMQGWSDAYTFSTNSVGPLSTVKITDMSGSLPSSGSAITVTAWDANGNALTQSGSATPLTLYNYGTQASQVPPLRPGSRAHPCCTALPLTLQ